MTDLAEPIFEPELASDANVEASAAADPEDEGPASVPLVSEERGNGAAQAEGEPVSKKHKHKSKDKKGKKHKHKHKKSKEGSREKRTEGDIRAAGAGESATDAAGTAGAAAADALPDAAPSEPEFVPPEGDEAAPAGDEDQDRESGEIADEDPSSKGAELISGLSRDGSKSLQDRHHKHHSSDRHRSSDKHRSDDKHRSSDSKRLDNGSGSRHPDSKSRDSKRHESSSGSKRHRSDREPAAPAGDAKNAAGSRPIADERETATPADLPPPPSDHAGDATREENKGSSRHRDSERSGRSGGGDSGRIGEKAPERGREKDQEKRREKARDRDRDRDRDRGREAGRERERERRSSRDRGRSKEARGASPRQGDAAKDARDRDGGRERRPTAERERESDRDRSVDRSRRPDRPSSRHVSREPERARDGRLGRPDDRVRGHSRDRAGSRGRDYGGGPPEWDRRPRDYYGGGRFHRGYGGGRPSYDDRNCNGMDRSRESEREKRARLEREAAGGRRSPSRERRGEKREAEAEVPAVDPEEQERMLEALEGGADEEDRLIQERRRRRQQILAKHKEASAVVEPTATAVAAAAAAVPEAAARAMAVAGEGPGIAGGATPSSAAQTPLPAGMSPSHLDASRAGDASQREGSASPRLTDDDSDVEGADGPERGAALDIWQHPTASGVGGAGEQAGGTEEAAVPPEGVAGGPATRGADVDEAQFADEAQKAQEQTQDQRAAGAGEFDMFAEEAVDATTTAAKTSAAGAGLADSYDDVDGYYNLQVGEIVNDRYEVFATHGRGVFSSVLRAKDRLRKDAEGGIAEVAIKVIRANETMTKAGLTERVILRKLAATDPEGKRHIIRMLSHFEYRGHLCLVFEPMAMNLRELTRKVARDVGISLPAVQLFGKQMLAALYHMHDNGVLHADIKPDNILINARHNAVKVCDFGSAMFAGDNSVTPYLVSRFYRPPEVILGLAYDYAMDMWSVGCVLYELFTGKILFPGRTNNEMLKIMMDVKGPFPKKMLRKGAFSGKHFDDDPAMSFKLFEEDPLSKRIVCRLISNPKVSADIPKRLQQCYGDKRHKEALADLLEKMLILDPEKRIRPKEALKHPFLKWGQTSRPLADKSKPAGGKAKPATAGRPAATAKH